MVLAQQPASCLASCLIACCRPARQIYFVTVSNGAPAHVCRLEVPNHAGWGARPTGVFASSAMHALLEHAAAIVRPLLPLSRTLCLHWLQVCCLVHTSSNVGSGIPQSCSPHSFASHANDSPDLETIAGTALLPPKHLCAYTFIMM